jgi:ribosomal protein S18 acetylase RimI-like enzyme
MIIEKASIKDLDRIIDLAKLTWFETYREILSIDQSNFMFNNMYNKICLIENMNSGNEFYILSENKDIGFMEVILYDDVVKISKIYINPSYQKKGFGKKLIDKAIEITKSNNKSRITLNVNRHNNAKFFYLKNNFKIIKEIDIEIGNGYLMEDYIMESLV